MNGNITQIQQIEKELAYYKKQVDTLSGNIISNQYALAQLSNVCKKFINGFQIIAEIQRSFSFYSRKEILYEQFLEAIFSQMFLDRVMLLEIVAGKHELTPVAFKGFDPGETLQLNNTALAIPATFVQEKRSFLVSSEVMPSEFEKQVQQSFLTPYFILIPLVKNQQVWGALFVGMKHEFKPMSYIPLAKSNIDMFESLAGMISAMTQQLEQRELMEKERNRIARDMHDDIGSELSKISITCEHLKNQFSTRPDVISDIEVIKESTVSIVNNIGNIIWALNPINNTLESLLGYLREYTFEFLELHRLPVVFNIPGSTDNRIIAHEVRTHFFMVVKEILHNIVKHAAANKVEINITVVSSRLCCSIQDDGAGFLIGQANRFGNGLRNMKQRITETGGILIIDAAPGKGTSIELEIPV